MIIMFTTNSTGEVLRKLWIGSDMTEKSLITMLSFHSKKTSSCAFSYLFSLLYLLVSARVPHSKKKHGTRRTSITRKSTSPGTGISLKTNPEEGSNSKAPVMCVISPPPLKRKDTESSCGNNHNEEPSKETVRLNVNNAHKNDAEQKNGHGYAAHDGSATKQSNTVDTGISNKQDPNKESCKPSFVEGQGKSRSKGVENRQKDKKEKGVGINSENIANEKVENIAESMEKAKLSSEHINNMEGSSSNKGLRVPISTDSYMIDNDKVTDKKAKDVNGVVGKVKMSDALNGSNDKSGPKAALKNMGHNVCGKDKQTADALSATIASTKSSHSVIVTKATIENLPVSHTLEANCHGEELREQVGEKPMSKSAERKAKMKSVQFSEGPVAVISTPVKYAKLDKQKDHIGVSVCLKESNDKNLSKNIVSSDSGQESRESEERTASASTALKNDDMTHFSSDKNQLQRRNKLQNSLRCFASEPKEVNKCSKSVASETTLHKAFNDSFVIDSQTDVISGSQTAVENNQKEKPNEIITDGETHSKSIGKSGPNSAHNFLKDCLHSESLFSQDDLYCSFNTSLEYFPAVDKDLFKKTVDVISTNTSDSGNVTSPVNVVDKISRPNTEELFSDRNDKSTEESVVSENDLELNISESGIDTSMDLIAASNYERIACSSVSGAGDQDANDSYADLHIPYQSGQELCFENHDHQNGGNITNNPNQQIGIVGNLIHKSEKGTVLGQFSSPKPVDAGGKYSGNDLQEDLAIALEMGDSFCSTFSTQMESKDKKHDKARSSVDKPDKGDMGDSLTFSMMEKVLDDDQIVDNENSELNKNEIVSKQSCDIVQNSNISSLVRVKSDTTSDIAKSVIVNRNKSQDSIQQQMSRNCDKNQVIKENEISPGTLSVLNSMDDSFLTPTCKSAPKRARNTQGCRTLKSQKMLAVGYSTPEALKTDRSRTRRKQNSSEKQEKTRKRSNERNSDSNIESSKSDKRLRKSESPEINREMDDNKGDSLVNTSTESDYVPPTPPDESHLSGSPFKQPRTPRGSLRIMSPFSPKLRNSKTVDNRSQKNDNPSRNRNLSNSKSQTARSQGKAKRSPNTSKTKRKSPKTASDQASSSVGQSGKVDTALGCDSKSGKSQFGSKVEEQNAQIASNTRDKKGNKELESEKHGEDEERTDGDDNDDDVDENLPASFLDLNESGIPLTQSSFTIIDVCADKRLFKTFIMEWRTKSRYAVALACEKRIETMAAGSGIGGKFQKGWCWLIS